MSNKYIILCLFVPFFFVNCSHKYSQDYLYVENINFNRNLVYVFTETGKSEHSVYYSLIGSTFGRQILIISTIKNRILCEDRVYVIKKQGGSSDDGMLYDNRPALLFPLYSVIYSNDDYHVNPPLEKEAEGFIVKNGSSLSLSFLNDKRKDLAMIDYTKVNEAFPYDIKLYSDNKGFHQGMTWFFFLIGKNIFVSIEIVGGATDLRYYMIDRRNETDYVKPIYIVGFLQSDSNQMVDNCFSNDLISVFIRNIDNDNDPNEFIMNKGSSIVYFTNGLIEELDFIEKWLIDYNKIKPVR